MSIDHVAEAVNVSAAHTAHGSPDGTAVRTAIVIDARRVRRDWRQTGAEATGSATAVTAGGALYLAAFEQAPALMWALTAGCPALAVACVVFLTLAAREGRRWTYATDTP